MANYLSIYAKKKIEAASSERTSDQQQQRGWGTWYPIYSPYCHVFVALLSCLRFSSSNLRPRRCSHFLLWCTFSRTGVWSMTGDGSSSVDDDILTSCAGSGAERYSAKIAEDTLLGCGGSLDPSIDSPLTLSRI